MLLEKIKNQSAHVVVIGIGYVGLPLVVEFARAGFAVTGYDKDARKVRLLAAGESYIGDIPTEDLAPHVKTREAARLDAIRARPRRGRRVVVCVPDAAQQDQGPGHALHRRRDRRDRAPPARGHAHRARVDDVPGHDARGARPEAHAAGLRARQGRLRRVLARARRPGQPEVRHAQHAQGHRRRHARVPRGRARALRADHRDASSPSRAPTPRRW